ncbi:TetR/AcrR family transcriptional regulator [Saccharopolyspora sp. K220]|uniref:TetR/AcrR family transcriptional regulator n=1 Tax=Saccharopolyspora soli TaxID=2926618 RepID=UPI001F59082E|nr:TetR/AcrR family transcriptional regulator [Saccharopolyspora soli]MCI2420739.1 TetR/AcrR family transcriptional regulator [Saccharopolyspora soli]
MSPVNKGGKRAKRARQTRLRMLQAAGELFVEHGYAATPLQDIADRAGVAVQTIYFTFRNKRTLLKEVVDTAIAGDDEPIATMDRSWFRAALDAETAEAQLRAHVAGVRHIMERVATISEMLRIAAAADPEIADLWQRDADPRYTVQAAAAKVLVTKPGVRGDLAAEHAADVLFGLLSPELYLLLVRDRGWSPEQWEQWAFDTLRAQLCQA